MMRLLWWMRGWRIDRDGWYFRPLRNDEFAPENFDRGFTFEGIVFAHSPAIGHAIIQRRRGEVEPLPAARYGTRTSIGKNPPLGGPFVGGVSKMPGETKKPIRVQLSRRKGWRMPPDTVKVD